MDSMSLQLQGIRNPDLLVTVMGLIALTLVGFGVFRLIRKATRDGVMCIAAAAPSVLVFALAGKLELGMWMLLLGIQVTLAVAVFYAAVYAYLGRRRVAVLMVMRMAAILSLLLILFKPAVSVTPNLEATKPYLPIVVDRSASMATTDQSGSGNRYTQSLRMLAGQQERLKQYFRPVYYHFATATGGVESLDELTRLEPKGPASEGTNIAAAIETISAKHRGDSMAGMLLLSDGIHNEPNAEPNDAASAAGFPIYSIGVGSRDEQETGRRNLQLVSVDAPFEVIKNNVATLTATVKVTGFANTASEVQIVEDGNVVASVPIMTDKGVAVIPLDVKWTPRDGKTKVSANDDAKKRSEVRKLKIVIPPLSGETVTEDNQGELHLLVTEPRIRVLYVEGTIRPEYKFLFRILNMDVNIQFMSLVRVRKNEFSSHGAVGGRTLSDLPKTDEDFRLFDVIILGDIDATYFSKEQLARLKQFVKDGGGLLMLGGHNSFGPGGYEGTDLEALLPVTMGSRNQPQETTPFVPQLTAEGQKHPIFDGIADYFTGPDNQPPKPELPKLPDLQGCVTVVGPKPLANVLAVHPSRRNEQGPLIVLAVQQYGAGRSAAFTSDTTWEWYMPMQVKGEESPYRLYWGQLIRWLSNIQTKNKNATPSVVLRVESPYVQAGKGVHVLARVQDDKGKASDTANVVCTMTPEGGGAGGEPVTMISRKSGGMFEVNLPPMGEGKYVLRASAADATNQPLGDDELNLTVAPHSAEMDQLARNEGLLQSIADRSGGRYADLSGLPEIVDQIIDRQKSRANGLPRTDSYKLYDFTVLFLVFVALLTGEWLLRRRWQLQ